MTRKMELPPNTLLHTFSVYNAIVEASDGTLIHWNNTLGFSNRDEDEDDELTHGLTPFVNIEGMTSIRAAVDAFVSAQPT